ncbi:hypothetical protein H0H93_001639 [Arthromyces matolae]|nr:hypothetical protein H0H93_001639 [Arthromyces matolae]
MQFKILFVLLFCCFTFGIPVVNTEAPEPPIDAISTNTANRRLTPRVFSESSLRPRGDPGSKIQAAIDECRNGRAHLLGYGYRASAWKVDLPSNKGVIQVVLKVIPFIGGGEKATFVASLATELHNLIRVGQLIEWGVITEDAQTVCYILMPYLGVILWNSDLLKKYPNLEKDYTTLQDQAWERYIQVHEMEHLDLHHGNVVFREETENGKKKLVAELVDWESAKDLTDPHGKHTPTSLDDDKLKKWEKKIVDDKMGRF